MIRIAYITVGNQDVALSTNAPVELQFHEDVKGRAALQGEVILANWGKYEPYIQYPIVQPFMEYLANDNKLPTSICFITTKQSEDISPSFRQKDTSNYGKILQKIIATKYPTIKVNNHDIEDNVFNLERMMQYWGDKLRMGNSPFSNIKEDTELYLLNQGGIDAINNGILLQMVHMYEDRIQHYAVEEKKDKEGRVRKSSFYSIYNKNIQYKQFVQAIQDFQYGQASKLTNNTNLQLICKHLQARLHFDFTKANNILVKLDGTEIDSKFQSLVDYLTDNCPNEKDSQFKKLQELLNNATIKLKQEAYVDFLLRMFRLSEGIGKETVRQYLDATDTQMERAMFWDILKQKRQINTILDKHIISIEIHNDTLSEATKLRFSGDPTNHTWITLLEKLDTDTYLILKPLQSLNTIRNNSIGAHNFDPCSLQLIEEKLAQENTSLDQVMHGLNKILATQNTTFEYTHINEKLISIASKI